MTPTVRDVRIEAVSEILKKNRYRLARGIEPGDWGPMWINIACEVLDHLDAVDKVIAATMDCIAHGDFERKP